MLNVPHLRDCYKLKYTARVPVADWKLPDLRIFWANRFNIFQVQIVIASLPFDLVVIGNNNGSKDVLLVRLGENNLLNNALILVAKAYLTFINRNT